MDAGSAQPLTKRDTTKLWRSQGQIRAPVSVVSVLSARSIPMGKNVLMRLASSHHRWVPWIACRQDAKVEETHDEN